MSKKKVIKFSIKLAVTLFFVAWIVFKTDWNEVLYYLKQIEPWQIAVYSATIVAGIAISSYKWMFLAKFKGIILPYKEFFNLYLAGMFINNFMPSFIAGDAFKAYQIGKPEKKYTEAASTVTIDRITGLFAASIMVVFFGVLNYQMVIENTPLLVANLVILFSLLLDILIAKNRSHPIFRKFARFLPAKILEFIRELGEYNKNPLILRKAILWSMLFDLVGICIANYLLFLALGVKIDFLAYSSIIFIISIISSLPISVNNIGIKEWAYITFFGILGVDASVAVTAAILSRLIQMIISFFALPVYLRAKKS
jgi:glycosyltransferase 2 family protein